MEELEKKIRRELEKAETRVGLRKIQEKYLGQDGRLSLILSKIKDLSGREKRKVGGKANEIRRMLERKVEARKRKLEKEREEIDVTTPGKEMEEGHLHPLTRTKRKVAALFQKMGFQVVEGPEVENEWYNFEALNIPEDHPARDMWDTFWLEEEEEGERLLMRTHTSPVQIREMEKREPPVRIVVPGKVFRHEKKDASHEFQLYHLEGLMVEKDVSAANFKAVVTAFFRQFFGRELEVRMRPSFFPFTEPSFEIDVECVVCGGKRECSTCSGTGWLELMGAGMVHPRVLGNAGFNPERLQGFAFGVGIDRLAMMRYKIPHIKWFHSGDLRFLKQF